MNNNPTQLELDIKTLIQLERTGSDMSLVHSVINDIYVYEEGRLTALLNEMKIRNYQVVTPGDRTEDEGTVYWHVEVAYKTIPTIENITIMTTIFNKIADQFNAEYDGWYTAVTNN